MWYAKYCSKSRQHWFLLLCLLVMLGALPLVLGGVMCNWYSRCVSLQRFRLFQNYKRTIKEAYKNNAYYLKYIGRSVPLILGGVFYFAVDQRAFFAKALEYMSTGIHSAGKVLTLWQRMGDLNKYTEGETTPATPQVHLVYITLSTKSTFMRQLDAIWQTLLLLLLVAIVVTILSCYYCGPENKMKAFRSVVKSLVNWIWYCEYSQSRDDDQQQSNDDTQQANEPGLSEVMVQVAEDKTGQVINQPVQTKINKRIAQKTCNDVSPTFAPQLSIDMEPVDEITQAETDFGMATGRNKGKNEWLPNATGNNSLSKQKIKKKSRSKLSLP